MVLIRGEQCKEEGIRIIRMGKGEILIGDLDFSLVVHFLQLSSFVIRQIWITVYRFTGHKSLTVTNL